MKRIVGLPSRRTGGKANKPPEPGIDDVVQATDRKSSELDSKAAQCDAELRKISQLLRNPQSGSSKQMLQEKAKGILARKKAFEQQAESLRSKSFNIDSLASSLTAANDMKLITGVLTSGVKQMKKQLKRVDLDEIEETQDELADLIELTEEVQNAISTNYAVPEDIDDEELNNQLELLGDEIIQDNDSSYIDEALRIPSPSIIPNDNGSTSPNGGPTEMTFGNGSGSLAVDEFGLPILNMGAVTDEGANKPMHRETKH